MRESSAQSCDTNPRIFKLLKEEIIRISDEVFTLLQMTKVKQQFEMRLPDSAFTCEELKAVVGFLAGRGLFGRSRCGRWKHRLVPA